MPVTAETFATLAETTTTADPGTAGTSLAVTTRTPFPQAGQFAILVQNSEYDKTGREVMLVTGGQGTGAGSFTVTRNYGGTSGLAHGSGSYVAQIVTAEALNRWVPEYVWQPRHHNMVAWNSDPVLRTGAIAPVTLVPRLSKVYVPETITITNMIATVGATAGATLVAGSNRMGVYDSTGTLLSQTADITAWTASSVITTALAAAQTITGGLGVFVWFALLVSATTMPTIDRTMGAGAGATANVGLAAADGYRCGSLAAVTSGNGLPASFTPSTGITQQASMLWQGAS